MRNALRNSIVTLAVVLTGVPAIATTVPQDRIETFIGDHANDVEKLCSEGAGEFEAKVLASGRGFEATCRSEYRGEFTAKVSINDSMVYSFEAKFDSSWTSIFWLDSEQLTYFHHTVPTFAISVTSDPATKRGQVMVTMAIDKLQPA